MGLAHRCPAGLTAKVRFSQTLSDTKRRMTLSETQRIAHRIMASNSREDQIEIAHRLARVAKIIGAEIPSSLSSDVSQHRLTLRLPRKAAECHDCPKRG
jgi:hypothetical protein